MLNRITTTLLCAIAAITSHAQDAPTTVNPPATKQVGYFSVEESLKTFQLPEGYHLQPVLTEPTIKEPVVCVWDGNGRMYVAEMRTYMQDIDGSGAKNPISRISMHEDKDGDGTYETHHVFIDELILPRMILWMNDGLLVGETDTNELNHYRDTNGDGVADSKTLVMEGGARGGNLEHQPSGLIWSMDNWIYSTYNAHRLRYKDGKMIQERTAANGGQWGLTQDHYGKVWFVNAGGEKGPLNFQTPTIYGSFNTADQFEPNFREVYPLVPIPDVQGGAKRFRPVEETLNHFTATCGQEIFRGDRLPADMQGDILFAEPVGRLIRRAKIDVKEGLTYLRNANPGSEFIRSTDPNFRPVNMVTGPDGCLYIVDMYRGIIQEGNWVKAGSYLRGVVQEYGLQRNFGRGRIYRLVHDDFKPGPKPNMLNESPAQLVKHLAHPNAWWRNNAQRQLILKDAKEAAPQLRKMVSNHANHLTRIHALWTLEGLGELTPQLIRDSLKDNHGQVRAAAIRVSETLYKAGDKSFQAVVMGQLESKTPEVALQAMLTANHLKFPEFRDLLKELAPTHSSLGVKEIGNQILNPPSTKTKTKGLSKKNLRVVKRGEAIFKQLCYSCHGADGKGTPLEGAPKGTTMAPPFEKSKTLLGHPSMPISVVLHGLNGPVDGKTYQALMVPMASQNDEWISDVVSFLRNSFGNSASIVTPAQVKAVRKTFSKRTATWTVKELNETFPHLIGNKTDWKLAASHNSKSLKNALDGNPKTRYETRTPQIPGMWVTVELPTLKSVYSIRLDSALSSSDYPRGYTVESSKDGQTWDNLITKGKGTTAITEISFEPIMTKHLRISQTGSVVGKFWSIHELDIFEHNPENVKKAASRKADASAASFE
ncbi:discoidin domain-containing protein [Verrucomicrobia bacterium]|nr:discoidin domain-containing protein [Verrucomicrobiota bacterium]